MVSHNIKFNSFSTAMEPYAAKPLFVLPAGSVESTLHPHHGLPKHSFLMLQSFLQNIKAVRVLSIYIRLIHDFIFSV